MSYPRTFNRKSTPDIPPAAWVLIALLAVPALAILAFILSLAIAAIGSLFMMAAVNGGLVTLGTVFGFTVHTVGLWGAFKLCYVSMILAGIFGGVRVVSNTKS